MLFGAHPTRQPIVRFGLAFPNSALAQAVMNVAVQQTHVKRWVYLRHMHIVHAVAPRARTVAALHIPAAARSKVIAW